MAAQLKLKAAKGTTIRILDKDGNVTAELEDGATVVVEPFFFSATAVQPIVVADAVDSKSRSLDVFNICMSARNGKFKLVRKFQKDVSVIPVFDRVADSVAVKMPRIVKRVSSRVDACRDTDPFLSDAGE